MSRVNCFLIYTMLFCKLLLPLAIARKLLFLLIVLFFAGTLLNWLYDIDVLLVICAGVFTLQLLIVAMILPAQALALVTSKHFMLLANLRWILAAVFCLFSLLIVLLTYIFLISNKSDHDYSSLPWVVFFLSSSFICLSVFAASCIPGGQGFVLALFFLIPKLTELTLPISPVWLFIATIGIWGCFLQWWLKWKPEKYQPNFMLFSIQDNTVREQKLISGWRFMWGRADTWNGSRLFGLPDSLSAYVQRFICSLPILILSFVPAYFLLPRDPLMLRFVFGQLVLFTLVLVGPSLLLNHYKNIKLIWLTMPGNRLSLLRYLECRYWLAVIPGVLINFAGLGLLAALLHIAYTPEFWIFILISALLQHAIMFNMAWVVYQKSAASMAWLGTIIVISVLLWMMLICWSGQLFTLPFDIQPLSSINILLCLTGAILVSRYWLKNSFSRINFLRAV